MCTEVTVEDINNEFKFVGISAVTEVLNKCLEICLNYNIDAETLVEEWVAFAETNLKGMLGLTLTLLDAMVRKQFADKVKTNNIVSLEQPRSALKVYNNTLDSDINKIINSYKTGGTPNDDAIGSKRNTNDKKQHTGISDFSQCTNDLSVCKLSSKYKERTEAREVQITFGSQELLDQTESSADNLNYRVSIKLLNEDDTVLSSDCRYMYEVIRAKAIALNNFTERVGRYLIKKNHLNEPVDGFIKFGLGEFTTYGRIRCDDNGHLNPSSVLLEGSMQFANGQVATINLKDVQACSLFPGQVVALQTVAQGAPRITLTPTVIFSDATLNLPEELPIIPGPGPLHVVYASGPFTLYDNLVYDPLTDLIKYVLNSRPHVLILSGPFVDATQPSVRDGSLAETFHTHFVDLIDTLMDQLKGEHTQVVLVPSVRDAHHHSVYPTPPYTLPKRYTNLHLVSDPSLLSINGLIIGVTSVDVLFHMAKVEMCWSPNDTSMKQDRMGRFVTHVLSQQNFYPLYPPVEGLPVDYEMLEKYATFSVTPHILILPSNLRYFVKNVNGCITINPERLTKGLVGGTFSHIKVFPIQANSCFADNVVCQIIKI